MIFLRKTTQNMGLQDSAMPPSRDGSDYGTGSVGKAERAAAPSILLGVVAIC